MNDSSKAIEETPQLETTDEKHAASSHSSRLHLLGALGCFALALAVALMQNMRRPVLELAMLFDSSTYLMSARYVLTAAHNLTNGMALDTALKSVGTTLLLNGPVVPGLGAAWFALIGKEPSLLDVRAALVLQAILHASASALLALAGWRFTGKRMIGLWAGIIFAVWPAAIIGASRFLSETITTLVISATLLAAGWLPAGSVRKDSQLILSPAAACAFGSSTALIILVKAALAPAALLAILAAAAVIMLCNVNRRSLFNAAVSFLIGFALVLSPWLIFTKIATGEFCLTAKRLPTFNLAAGLSPETDGLSALGETPLVNMFSEGDGPAAVASAFYNLSPGDFYGRMARKPLRLFQYPWNDCRFDLLGIPVAVQIIAHQFLVVFGFMGLLAFAALPLYRAEKKSRQKEQQQPQENDRAPVKQPHPELQLARTTSNTRPFAVCISQANPGALSTILIGVVCLSLIAGHLAYLPFVAENRYGFTSIPCLIMFAVWCFSGQLRQKLSTVAVVRLFIAAAFIILAVAMKEDAWKALFATSAQAMFASILTLAALLLFIGCLLAVRTLLGTGKYNAPAKVLTLTASYLTLMIVLAASMLGKENPCDWQSRLTDSEEMCRIVDIPNNASPPTSAMVLTNIIGDWRAARLKVNGQLVDSAPISLLQLTGNPELSNAYRSFGFILHSDTSGLDQWRAFPVPTNLIKQGEQNTLSITGEKNHSGAAGITGSTIYGETRKNKNSCYTCGPSLSIFSPTNLVRNPLSLDPRIKERMPKPVAQAVCVRKINGKTDKDLSSTPGTQLGQYHMFLLVAQTPKQIKPDKAASPTGRPIYIDVVSSAQTTRATTAQSDNRSLYWGAAKLPKSSFGSPFVRFNLTGEADCASTIEVQILLNDLRLMQSPIELACSPSRIEGDSKRKFSVETIAQASVVDSETAYAMIKISSDLVPLAVSNLRLEVEPQKAPALNIGDKRWY